MLKLLELLQAGGMKNTDRMMKKKTNRGWFMEKCLVIGGNLSGILLVLLNYR